MDEKHILKISREFPPLLRNETAYSDDILEAIYSEVTQNGGNEHKKRIGIAWMPSRKANIRTQDDEEDRWTPKDDLRPLNDVCTKFCCQTFFPNALARLAMVGNILRLYNRFSKRNGLRYKIIFKGGVMLRLVLLQFWKSFPETVSHLAIEYLRDEKAIGLGDFDFEIVPDELGEHEITQERKYKYLYVNTFALMYLQKYLVREIETKRTHMLNVSWNREVKESDLRDRLQAEIDSLPKTNSLSGARVNRVVIGSKVDTPPKGFKTRSGQAAPTQRKSVFVFKAPDKSIYVCDASVVARDLGMRESTMRRCEIGRRNDFLYTTCNMHINEDPDEQTRKQQLDSHFHLSRIKHTFTMYYTTKTGEKRCDRISGEMVDLSMGDPNDEKRKWMHDAIRGDSFRRYHILGVPDVDFWSYSPEKFWKDHEGMLHRSEVPPWDAPKYGKRIVRYIAFLIIVVMTEGNDSLSRRVDALRSLLKYVNTSMREKMKRTGNSAVDHFADVEHDTISSDLSTSAELGQYLTTLRGHMKRLVDIAATAVEELSQIRPFRALDITHLDYMDQHKLVMTGGIVSQTEWSPKQARASKIIKKRFNSHQDLDKLVNRCVYKSDPRLRANAIDVIDNVIRQLGSRPAAMNVTQNIEWILMALVYTYVPSPSRPDVIAFLIKRGILSSSIDRVDNRDFKLSYTLIALDVAVPSIEDLGGLLAIGRKMIPIISKVVTVELCKRIAKCIHRAAKGSIEVRFGTRPIPKEWNLVNDLHLYDFYVTEDDKYTTKSPVSDLFTVRMLTAGQSVKGALRSSTETGIATLDVTVPFFIRYEKYTIPTSWFVLRLTFIDPSRKRHTFLNRREDMQIHFGKTVTALPFYTFADTPHTLYGSMVRPGTLGAIAAIGKKMGTDFPVLDPTDREVMKRVSKYLNDDGTIRPIHVIEGENLEDRRF